MTWWSLFIQTLSSCYTTSWDSTRDDGVAGMIFFDDQQNVRAGVGLKSDGSPDVGFYDPQGNKI